MHRRRQCRPPGRNPKTNKISDEALCRDEFLVCWIVVFAVAVCQLSVEVIVSSSMLVSGIVEVCSPECDLTCP